MAAVTVTQKNIIFDRKSQGIRRHAGIVSSPKLIEDAETLKAETGTTISNRPIHGRKDWNGQSYLFAYGFVNELVNASNSKSIRSFINKPGSINIEVDKNDLEIICIYIPNTSSTAVSGGDTEIWVDAVNQATGQFLDTPTIVSISPSNAPTNPDAFVTNKANAEGVIATGQDWRMSIVEDQGQPPNSSERLKFRTWRKIKLYSDVSYESGVKDFNEKTIEIKRLTSSELWLAFYEAEESNPPQVPTTKPAETPLYDPARIQRSRLDLVLWSLIGLVSLATLATTMSSPLAKSPTAGKWLPGITIVLAGLGLANAVNKSRQRE